MGSNESNKNSEIKDFKIDMNNNKVNKLKNILTKLGVESAKTIEENVDLQYYYLKNLYKRLKNDELFLKLVILNSIVSYQLTTTGENWWREFSEYNWNTFFNFNKFVSISMDNQTIDSDEIINNYISFLNNSKGNKRLLKIKMKRINKLGPLLNELDINKLKYYYMNMVLLRQDIAKQLNTKPNSKTVVFTVKMFGYASRIVFKEFIAYPYEIEIPKDSRIEKYTKKFTEKNVLEFWNNISKDTKIPPLHIDSILWSALGNSSEVKSRLNSLENNNIKELVYELINI